MNIRHERPSADLSFEVRAPLGLELADGTRVEIAAWSLDGITYPDDTDILPAQGRLIVPFQGVEVSFMVQFDATSDPRRLRFKDLSGRERETLAVFYRSILSGKMAHTDTMITALDTPVDLVPMGETEEETTSATAGKSPRVLRVAVNLASYVLLATLVFGFLGQHIWARIDRIDIQRGRVVAPLVEQAAPISGFVRDMPAEVGDRVRLGDTLLALRNPDLDRALAETEAQLEAAREALAAAQSAQSHLTDVITAAGEDRPVTYRLALAARIHAEFFNDRDLEEMRRLWVTLRDQDRDLSENFSPDLVIAERLGGLVADRKREVARLDRELAKRREAVASALIVAETSGIIRDVLVHPDQYLQKASAVVVIEEDAPRVTMGWMPAHLAESVHIGQPALIRYSQDTTHTALEGKVIAVSAGQDPGQPNEFGMLVTVAADGLSTDATRDLFAADAPVTLAVKRGLFSRQLAWTRSNLSSLYNWVAGLVG